MTSKNQCATLLMLVAILQLSCAHSQDNIKQSPDLKLSEVISFARKHIVEEPAKNNKSKIYPYFDFNLLRPSQKLSDIFSSADVFYNNSKVQRVILASKFKDSDFDFYFVNDSIHGYTIFFAEQIYDSEYENEQGDIANGFFLAYEGHCYFIGLEGPLCIMQLDSDLKAIQTLRFESNRLHYKTKVNYRDKCHLYSDTFYSPMQVFEITDETTIGDVVGIFSRADFEIYKEIKIGWVREDDHLPLWIFGGHHEYDWLAKP